MRRLLLTALAYFLAGPVLAQGVDPLEFMDQLLRQSQIEMQQSFQDRQRQRQLDAATELPPNYPAQDYGRLFDRASAAGVGMVGIRVLAGGALSGSTERHPIPGPPPEPIGSAVSYDADVARARRLLPLVKEGFAASLTEAATRFAISHSAVGTILVGMATPRQFEDALAAVQKGQLPSAALDRLSGLQRTLAGELR
jgi:hypothetical protein